MGVVNATPDSFSDGGAYDPVAQGRRLLAEGADLLDVGGESTRPGAARVEEDEELRRVLPVVRALAAAGAVVSVDTTRAAVAVGRRRGRRARWSTTSPAASPTRRCCRPSRSSACRTSSCTGAGTATS